MPRSKAIAATVLLGTFLAGAAVGVAADRALSRGRPSRAADERAMREGFAKHLSLSVDQRRHVDSVLDWRRTRTRELMQRNRPALDSIRDSADVLIRQVLDSTQRSKLTALMERNRRQSDSSARTRGAR